VRRSLRRAFIFSTCVVAFAATAATAANAADSTSDDAQFEDVSKRAVGKGREAPRRRRLRVRRPSSMFAAWGDDSAYVLAPQGDLAASDGWTLNKQATVVPTADPFSGAQNSLQFVKGAEAGTPAMCVALDNPTIRFFIRDSGGNEKSRLKVDVLYEDFGGHVKHLTIAKLRAGSDWEPSVILPMYMNVLALASPSGVTAVAFRFKAEGLQKGETLSISSPLR
jgi:hypothetical protein